MIQLSTPPGEYRQSWASQVFAQIQQAFGYCVKTNEAAGRVILQSPNGKSWAVTVDNSGTLTVTVMDGTER